MPLTIIPLGVAKVIQMHSNNTPLREIHLVNGKMPY